MNLTACARGYIAGKEPLECSYEANTVCDIYTTTSTIPPDLYGNRNTALPGEHI